MSPLFISSLIAAAVAGAIGFKVAWNYQAWVIQDIRMEQKDERIEQQRAARATSERLANQVIAAQNAAAERSVALRRDADRSADAGSGLRIASASAVQTSTEDASTCAASIATYDIVLGELSQVAEGLAIAADAWASQAVMLQDAWPR